MSGNDEVLISLTLPQWREIYRTLDNDHGWRTHLRTIEKACKRNSLTIPFLIHQVWPMSATIRQVNPELADAIRESLAHQRALLSFADCSPESSPLESEPTESNATE